MVKIFTVGTAGQAKYPKRALHTPKSIPVGVAQLVTTEKPPSIARSTHSRSINKKPGEVFTRCEGTNSSVFCMFLSTFVFYFHGVTVGCKFVRWGLEVCLAVGIPCGESRGVGRTYYFIA